MGPGMPGFGIASIFYIGVALLAPANELRRMYQGTSTRERRRTAITQFFIGASMLAALVLFYVGINALIARGWLDVPSRGLVGSLPNWVFAVVTLIVVLLIGTFSGAIASLRSADDHPTKVAAAHHAGVAEVVADLHGRDPSAGSAKTTEVDSATGHAYVASAGSDLEPKLLPDRLTRAADLLHGAFESAPVGMFLADDTGSVRWGNATWRNQFGVWGPVPLQFDLWSRCLDEEGRARLIALLSDPSVSAAVDLRVGGQVGLQERHRVLRITAQRADPSDRRSGVVGTVSAEAGAAPSGPDPCAVGAFDQGSWDVALHQQLLHDPLRSLAHRLGLADQMARRSALREHVRTDAQAQRAGVERGAELTLAQRLS